MAIESRRVQGVETLAKYAGVPVYNGLTDECPPTQMIATSDHARKTWRRRRTIRYAYLRRHALNRATR